MNGGMGGWGTFAFVGPFVGLLFVGAVVYVLWNALGGQQSASRRAERSDDAIETLRKQYARGEIDEETFERRAQTLREK